MDFPPNSDKSKAEKRPEKSVEKVVTGVVIQKPKTVTEKFRGIFFGGNFKLVARRVGADVLLPAFRNLVADTAVATIERMIYGESPRARRRIPDPRGSTYHYNYNTVPLARDPRHRSMVQLPDQPPRMTRTGRRGIDHIILSSREEANLVVETMMEILDRYEVVTYADLLEMVGLPSSEAVDNKWGWTYLNNIEIRQIRDGYLIELPDLEAV